MRLKALLLSLIPSLFAATSLAQNVVNVTAGQDLGAAIKNAAAGTTINVGAGTFNIGTPVTIQSGVKLLGVSPSSSHVIFNIAGDDTSLYAIEIAGGATGVQIEELDLVSNHGIISMGDGSTYTDVEIKNNNIQTGGGQSSSGVLVYGISGTITNNGLLIDNNYFHDSTSARNWTVWFANNSHFDNNVFYNINDGGQICSPGPGTTFNNNYGTYIHRMGQEVSLQSNSTFTCDGNTFYNYVLPYYDTEGVSVVGPSGAVEISNNYFDASIAPGSTWGQPDGGGAHRFGYAIECTGNPSNVSNNTLVGTWAELVSSDVAGANVTGNKVFGSGLWGDFEGEPGLTGYGSVNATGNSIDQNAADAPAPPASIGGVNGAGATGSPSSPITSSAPPPTGNLITGVTVTVLNSTQVKVTYTSPSTDITTAQVNIISTVGRQNFPSYTVPDPTDATPSFTISGLHPGWYIDFTIVANGSQTYKSNPVTAFMPGNSLAPWQGLLWGGISVLQTNPYVQ